ncbi:DUF3617 family protein [bacterium]|nr:DUF3617 family protein [bacterium]
MSATLRIASIAALAVATLGLASADSVKDGAIAAKPGMWKWEQQTSILGVFNSSETNLECLIPEKAKITLSRLARDLDEGCTVDNVVPTSDGYTFKLICKGDVSGKADARITHVADRLSVRAKGSARWGIIVAGLSMSADATFMGDCPADELERQREKWREEQAKENAGAAARSG